MGNLRSPKNSLHNLALNTHNARFHNINIFFYVFMDIHEREVNFLFSSCYSPKTSPFFLFFCLSLDHLMLCICCKLLFFFRWLTRFLLCQLKQKKMLFNLICSEYASLSGWVEIYLQQMLWDEKKICLRELIFVLSLELKILASGRGKIVRQSNNFRFEFWSVKEEKKSSWLRNHKLSVL